MKVLAYLIMALPATLLIGCGPTRVTVYGQHGTPYVAPDLCAAELACEKAGESSCYFNDDSSTLIDPQTGKKTVTVYTCHKVSTSDAQTSATRGHQK